MEIPENLDNNSSALIMELVKGKEYASQLQAILHNTISGDQDSASAEELAQNVFRSFDESLVKLSLLKSLLQSNQIGSDEATDRASSGHDLRLQHLNEGKKNHVEVKNRRGCYQRRRQFESYVVVSPLTDDGYAWRKYGQKDTLNSKYPRCYFRCSHKHDEGCRAIKQVQKVDDDQEKSIYQTTYFGNHTCKTFAKDPQLIISESETVGQSQSPNLICFQGKANHVPLSTVEVNQANHVPLSTVEVNHQESKGDTQSEVTENVSSDNSNFMWHDLVATESSNMDLFPKMECFHDQEAASGSLVHLYTENFNDNTQLFQW